MKRRGEGVVEGDEGSGKSWRGEGLVSRGYEGEWREREGWEVIEGEGSDGGGREWWRGKGVMEGEGSDGGTDGGEESGGAGLSFCLWVVIFIGKQLFVFVGGCFHWWVFMCGWGVTSWVLIICTWELLSSALLFVVMVQSVGMGCRLWMPHHHSWVVGLVCWRCTSFMGGGLRFVGGGGHTSQVNIPFLHTPWQIFLSKWPIFMSLAI